MRGIGSPRRLRFFPSPRASVPPNRWCCRPCCWAARNTRPSSVQPRSSAPAPYASQSASRMRKTCYPIWLRLSTRHLPSALQVADQDVAELAAFHLGGTLHLARKIVGHGLLPDGLVHGADDGVGRLDPTQVTQHHLAR